MISKLLITFVCLLLSLILLALSFKSALNTSSELWAALGIIAGICALKFIPIRKTVIHEKH